MPDTTSTLLLRVGLLGPCPTSDMWCGVVRDVAAVLQSAVATTVFGEIYSDDAGKTWHNSTGGGESMSVRFLGVNGDGGMKYACAGTYFNDKLQQVQVCAVVCTERRGSIGPSACV